MRLARVATEVKVESRVLIEEVIITRFILRVVGVG